MRVTVPSNNFSETLEKDSPEELNILLPPEEFKGIEVDQLAESPSKIFRQSSGFCFNKLQVPGTSENGQTDNRSTAFGSNMNTYEQSESKSFGLRPSNQVFNDDFEEV